MSGGKRRSTSRTNQSSRQSLSPWSQREFTRRSGTIDNMLNERQFERYGGPLVADLSDREQRARGLFENNMGSYSDDFDEARGMIRSAGTHADFGDVSGKYMNPYQREVVDVAVDDIHRYNDERNAQAKERSLQNRAYGGSGHQVAEALNNEAAMRETAKTTANLNYQGYNDARGFYDRDIQDQIRRGGLIADLGAREHQMGNNDIMTLNSMGEVERGIEQDRMGANYNEHLRGEEDFYRRLAAQQQMLGMTPMMVNSAQNGTTTTTERSSPGLMGALGTAASIGSMFIPGGQIAGLGGLFSSAMRTAKTPSHATVGA